MLDQSRYLLPLTIGFAEFLNILLFHVSLSIMPWRLLFLVEIFLYNLEFSLKVNSCDLKSDLVICVEAFLSFCLPVLV